MRNNPIYTSASTNINSLIFLFYTFSLIYTKNPFYFIFILLNYLIKSILTLIVPITSIFTSKAALLPYNWLTTSYNYPIMTT